MGNLRRSAWLPWASVSLLALLCGMLAVLQYRWIGEITGAERSRLREALQSRLFALSRAFNLEYSNAFGALAPAPAQLETLGREGAYAAQYLRWKDSHERLFSRVALVVPDEEEDLRLLILDLNTGRFSPGVWPAEWNGTRDELLQRVRGGQFGPMAVDPMLFEMPRFGMRDDDGPVREQEWLLAEVNVDYVRNMLLPELLNRYLGEAGKLDYEAEVETTTDPPVVIYGSDAHAQAKTGKPDAAVPLLDIRPMFGGRGRGGRARGGRGPGRGPGPGGPPPDGGPGRWRLMVRHKAGSLDALVDRTRLRNLGISGAVLLLILATVALLVRFSRESERLAQLQMNFVAGVSHEFRTPLTVIRTAAFNLRGRLGTRPEQVEKYGRLIQDETDKLTALIEQVLRFASMNAGHVIRAKEPVVVENVIEDGLRTSRAALGGPGLVVEKHIDPRLPVVLADEMALRHALQNLVDNALKYGIEGSNWIGVFATAVNNAQGSAVEIRVADRGPGIPAGEQEHIFDPFFRGRRAVQDQVHGTGLGLNLVKKIVEAHGGSIRVKSEPMQGTEFIVRIPAAPPELQDEFAHSFD